MAIYTNDTFTASNGTLLNAHTSNDGGSWTGQNSNLNIQSNQLATATFAGDRAVHSASPASADYEVLADLNVNHTGLGSKAGIRGRMDAAGPGTGYEAYFDESATTWYLKVWTGGNSTDLGSYVDSGFTSGTKQLKLRMIGTTITVYIDGVSRISVTDSTVSATNHPGLYNEGGWSDGILLDNYLCQDVAAGGAQDTPELRGRPFGLHGQAQMHQLLSQ